MIFSLNDIVYVYCKVKRGESKPHAHPWGHDLGSEKPSHNIKKYFGTHERLAALNYNWCYVRLELDSLIYLHERDETGESDGRTDGIK